MYQTLSATSTAMWAHSPEASTSPSSSERVRSRSAITPFELAPVIAGILPPRT